MRVVCPYCEGDACDWCDDTGFLDPDEAEAMQGRAATFDPQDLDCLAEGRVEMEKSL